MPRKLDAHTIPPDLDERLGFKSVDFSRGLAVAPVFVSQQPPTLLRVQRHAML